MARRRASEREAAARGARPFAATVVLGLALGAGLFMLVRRPPEGAPEPLAATQPVHEAAPVEGPGALGHTQARQAEGEAPAAPGRDGEADAAALDAAPLRRVLPAPRHHPRPAGEWQGMLVDLSLQPACDRADGCGLAMACIDGRCGPCRADADCAAGEACALDHCVPRAAAACRGVADCPTDSLCVLSGYSPDPRGNAEMAAACQTQSGGSADENEPRPEPPPDAAAQPRAVTPGALRDSLPFETEAE